MNRLAISRLLPNPFTTAVLITVGIATLVPPSGQGAQLVNLATDVGIGLLFFLHGARLSREAVISGITHWRLHLTVFASTFILFPLLGLALRPLVPQVLTPELYLGILFLCALPSTVQSSIAFTSVARGNVSAAVCSATASNLIGVFLTPMILALLLGTDGNAGTSLSSIGPIVRQLLVPFVLGHLLQPWVGSFVRRQAALLRVTDQGAILLVIYAAFGKSVGEGLWRSTPPSALIGTLVVCVLLLSVVMLATRLAARRLGFDTEDEIVILFCGSKKTLASGVPMAKVLFAGHAAGIGAIVLPLMLFHQIQLMACAVLAERYAARFVTTSDAAA